MKTNLKAIALAALTLAAPLFASAATPNSNVSLKTGMYVSKDGNLNVFLENQYVKPTTVVFKDANGKVLFERKAGYSKNLTGLKFDVNGLPDGEYTVEITNGKDAVTQSIKVEPPKAERAIIPAR